MKDRALLHVLLASARAAESVATPDEIGRLRQAATTLSVERPGRGQLLVAWSDGETPHDRTIDSNRFTFARRGDVAGIVARRPDGVDDRTANWREALTLWCELLDLPNLAGRIDDVPRTVNGSRSVQQVTRRAPIVTAAVALVVAVLAQFVLEGAAALTALGLALVAAVTVLVPFRHETRWLVAARVAGVLTVGLTWNDAPVWALVAAGLLLLADLAVLALQQDRRRITGAALTVGAGAVAAVAVGASLDPIEAEVVTTSTGALLASLGAALVLIAIAVVSFFRGVRDRLSAWLMPAGFVVAVLGSPDTWESAGWLGAAAVVVAASSRSRSSRDAASEQPTSPVGTAVQVSFGRQSTNV